MDVIVDGKDYISKDKLKEFITEKMKNLCVDTGVGQGKYEAYRSIINEFQLRD